MTHRSRAHASEWILLFLVVAVAAVLRFVALGDIPPGLYRDEAYNGLDAVQVLRGTTPVFFEANNGREPLFIYLVSAAVALLGRTPVAIRIVAAILGTLTLPAAYLLFRAMYGRGVALVGAAALALTVWPIQLSRIGFRAVALPLFTALALWQLWAAVRSGKMWRFALAGVLYGASFYTYLAARFTPVALVAWLLLRGSRQSPPVRWRHLLVFAVAALVVLAPLAAYVGTHWDSFSARAGQVSVFNPAINGGDLWGTLARHAVGIAGMFNVRGDFIPRHNVPLRPVFDPLLGAVFLLGVIVAAVRRSDADRLALAWVGVMLLPTLLAEDAPHFLRGVGILPVLFVFPALGLHWLGETLARRTSRRLATAVIIGLLVGGLAFTVRDYFMRYARDPSTAYAFEAGPAQLAAETNAYVGAGWQGGWTATSGAGAGDRTVYLARRLWDSWPSLRFLLADADAVRVLGGGEPAPPTYRVRLVVWPYEPYADSLRLLPIGSAIQVMRGPLERGDLEAEPRLVSITIDARPASELAALPIMPGAVVGEMFRLAGAALVPADDDLTVTLHWQALNTTDVNYMIFVHVVQPGQPLTTGDGPACGGYYPTHFWRAGDWIVDERVVQLPRPFDPAQDQVIVGMYDLETLQRLSVVRDGTPSGDSIALNP
ncbi:MAG: glycosyltransferase family 39 protein [Anaerolineae bacterium]|nr:glycosyltransferase family 39 protein [Anaerolineae bacterium]